MFAVIFEAAPSPAHQSAYMSIAASLRPELAAVDGFVENVRYRSLTRPGWILSLSIWRDEKALVRWRTVARHHDAQARGRDGVIDDYHLRVGQILGEGGGERTDVTEVGDARCVVLVDDPLLQQRGGDAGEGVKGRSAEELAVGMGLHDQDRDGLVAWDVLEAVLNPGDIILMSSWLDEDDGARFCEEATLQQGRTNSSGRRYRRVRILRDYAKFDRREAPQYYEDAVGRETTH